MARAGLALTAAIMLLLGAMVLKGELIRLPGPPEGAGAGRFDADRAAARLSRILGDERPHPVDSAANDSVRQRLIAEMRAVGLEPRLTDDFACNGFARSRYVSCARVRNLVATIGPAGGRHLLLASHYDSTFAGPGAADAGIAVTTLLETAALLRGRRLDRPVTFLFNEGEEVGLIGARAFLERDPVAPSVGALLNFEARGVTGPATMFETSRPNAEAIARFARAVDRPVANSLSTDLYRLIPNSTDVAVFEERDWTILNFAILANETRYHSAGDELAALDRRSLQHMGDQALALALDLAAGPPAEAQGERIYADLLGRQLIVLPLLFGLVLLGLLLAFFALEAWRRRGLGRPLAAMAAALAGSALAAFLAHFVMGLIRAGDWWRGHPWVTELAVYASAAAAGLAALVLIVRNASPERLRAAFWLLFMLCGGALALVAPGGSIYFLLPPLAAAIGMALARRWPVAEPAGAVAAVLLLYLTFGPSLALFEELMSGGPHWMFAPLGAAILLPALVELKPLMARLPRILLLAGAGDLVLLPWLAVAFTPAYSADRQQLFTIDYVWDQDDGRGRWAVNNDGRPVPYAADWSREELPFSERRRWVAPAPRLPAAPPAVTVTASEPVAGGRRLTLRLAANGAESVMLIAPEDSALRTAGAAPFVQPFGNVPEDGRYVLRCTGRSCDGATLELTIAGEEPVEFTIVGTRTGLPAAGAPLVAARPPLARAQYAPDSTIAYATLRI